MSPRRVELAVDLATGLMVVSVAIALAGLTWRLAGDPGHAPRGTTAVRPAAAPVDISPILALAPFGRVVASSGAAAPGLELRAVLLAQPRSASTVLIAPADGPAQSYAIGQAVPGGATIDAIEIDHVVLRVGAQTQLLGFPRAAGAAGGDPFAPPVAVAPADYAPPAPAAPTPPGEAANNRAFLDTMGATVTDGGYRIGPNPAAAARLAGLLPGDVIQKVNGNPVGDIDRDSRLLDAAFRSGGARVEVLRGGRQFTLSFPGR